MYIVFAGPKYGTTVVNFDFYNIKRRPGASAQGKKREGEGHCKIRKIKCEKLLEVHKF